MQLILILICFLSIKESLSQASWWAKHKAQLSCSEPGYFVNPADCHKFYRCVDRSTWSAPKLDRYDFECPNGMVFDTSVSVCSNPGRSGCAEPWFNTQKGNGEGMTTNTNLPSPGPPSGGFWEERERPDSDEGFGGGGGGLPNKGNNGVFGSSGRPAKGGNPGQAGQNRNKAPGGDDGDGFLDLGGDNEKDNGGNSIGSTPGDDGVKPNDDFLDLGGDGEVGGNNAGFNTGGIGGPGKLNRPGAGVDSPFGGRGPGGGSNADVDPLDIDFGSSVENPGSSGSNELGNNNSDDDSKSGNSDGDSEAGGNDAESINKHDDDNDGNKGGQNNPLENDSDDPNKEDMERAFWVGAKPGLGQMTVPNRKPPPGNTNQPQVICRPGTCNTNTGQGFGGTWGNNLGQGNLPGGGKPNGNWGQGSRPTGNKRPGGTSANWGGASRPSVPENISQWRPTGPPMWGSPPTTGESNPSDDESAFDGSSNESPNTDSGGGGGSPRPDLSWWGPPPPTNPDFAASAPYPYRPPRYPAYEIVAYPTWPGPYGRRPILVVYSNSKK